MFLRQSWKKNRANRILRQIDTLPLSWAVHQLGGLVTPANAVYSGPELKYQLQDAKPKALFTSTPLLSTALEAASLANFPKDKIYLIDLPPQMGHSKAPSGYKTLAQIEEAGKSLPKVEKLNWKAGEAARRTAFLCYSSGTSGLPVCRMKPWSKGQKLTTIIERCYDFSPECHRQRYSTHVV